MGRWELAATMLLISVMWWVSGFILGAIYGAPLFR